MRMSITALKKLDRNFPYSVSFLTPSQPQPEVQFSGRHNGLYLYLSRLLRPVWASPLVVGPEAAPASALAAPELEAVTAQLHDLAAFLDRTASLDVSLGRGGGGDNHAILKEKQSLQWVSWRFTIAPFHHCTIAPLHHGTIAPLHLCTR